jgi:hypothetical protein
MKTKFFVLLVIFKSMALFSQNEEQQLSKMQYYNLFDYLYMNGEIKPNMNFMDLTNYYKGFQINIIFAKEGSTIYELKKSSSCYDCERKKYFFYDSKTIITPIYGTTIIEHVCDMLVLFNLDKVLLTKEEIKLLEEKSVYFLGYWDSFNPKHPMNGSMHPRFDEYEGVRTSCPD